MALRHISLRDFVIVRQLDLDLSQGFSVLTGETGAGKSILIDALQLALGERADASVVREGAARWAPLIASFKPDRWSGTLDYTTMRGTAASLPFAATLAHVFNHGTHHRGQITAALTALDQPSPELDLVYFLQNPSTP